MDFIEGLPKSEGKSVIWVVVDRLTKYGHFIPLHHPFTAAQLAQVYIAHIYKLHGLPGSIVSDRDKVFISLFWQSLFKTVGTKLSMSTAFHPQTDGQTERLNQVLECYLRCMVSDHPQKWVSWIPLAEWWYNSHFHTSLKATPFEMLYGYKTPHLNFHQFGQVTDPLAKSFCQERTQFLKVLKQNLLEVQSRYKLYADRCRSERSFQVGDEVYLKAKSYRQSSMYVSKYHC